MKLREKIWRTDIGHYGGLFVEVPAEHLKAFKKAFPKREIPRRVRKKQMQDIIGVEAEGMFHKKFPKSGGVIHDFYFGDRSKGLKRLEKLLEPGSFVIDPFKKKHLKY